eukprot:gene3998-biopygen21871
MLRSPLRKRVLGVGVKYAKRARANLRVDRLNAGPLGLLRDGHHLRQFAGAKHRATAAGRGDAGEQARRAGIPDLGKLGDQLVHGLAPRSGNPVLPRGGGLGGRHRSAAALPRHYFGHFGIK